MGDLTGTVCSLTKAFLFKSAGGELPENHSQGMNLFPSGEEEVNTQRTVPDGVIIQMRMEMDGIPPKFIHRSRPHQVYQLQIDLKFKMIPE